MNEALEPDDDGTRPEPGDDELPPPKARTTTQRLTALEAHTWQLDGYGQALRDRIVLLEERVERHSSVIVAIAILAVYGYIAFWLSHKHTGGTS